MVDDFIIRPIGRKRAAELCRDHPHAGTLPNSGKYHMECTLGGRVAGLAVWGYGVQPKGTPRHLFRDDVCGVGDYLELCRFFIYDWAPKNTASRFLAGTHRIIRRYAKDVKWLYTYAAGFQGLLGYIYKATGYDYIGTQECAAFIWVPEVGLVHWVSLWHRYHLPIGSGRVSKRVWPMIHRIFPGATRWCGYNFRYLYWLCDNAEKERLMAEAKFEVLRYPTEADIHVWTEDCKGVRANISPEFAKSIPIVKLKTKRPTGEMVSRGTSSAK